MRSFLRGMITCRTELPPDLCDAVLKRVLGSDNPANWDTLLLCCFSFRLCVGPVCPTLFPPTLCDHTTRYYYKDLDSRLPHNFFRKPFLRPLRSPHDANLHTPESYNVASLTP